MAYGDKTRPQEEQDAKAAYDASHSPAQTRDPSLAGTGKSQSELLAEQKYREKYDPDMGDSERNKIRYGGASADVGGGVGGAKAYSDFFRAGEKRNDGLEAGNNAAMGTSLEAMRTGKGAKLAPEDAGLLANLDAARRQQGSALDMARDAAAGRAPSAANQQMAMAMDQNMAQAAGNAGSARGLAGLNGAQAMGAQATGMAGTQAAMTGGMGRSKEIGDAMGLYGSGAMNMAQGDIERLAQGNKAAVINQKLKDDWRLGNAGVATGQMGLANNMQATDDAYYNQSTDAYKRQMEYDQRMNALENGQDTDLQSALSAAREQRDNTRKGLLKGATSTVLTGVGTMFGGPAGGAVGGMAGSGINSAY